MSTAQTMYELYVDAEKKILQGQSVKFGERMLTRANLAEVREGRREWENKLSNSKRKKGHRLASF